MDLKLEKEADYLKRLLKILRKNKKIIDSCNILLKENTKPLIKE